MRVERALRRRLPIVFAAACLIAGAALPYAQQITETRDPQQRQDEGFARLYKEWTGDAKFGSPLVDHLPLAKGIPTPKDIIGYYVGAPRKLTYYADILRYYRALAAATARVKVETIGRSDEGRELVVVWVSSEQNMKALRQNRDNLAKLADPRGLDDAQVRRLIDTTKPQYHLIGGLHSSESGPSEMLMELVYRLATETSPFITAIRNNVYVSVTPVADADGRDRYVDWFYRGLDASAPPSATTGASGPATGSGSRAEAGRGTQPGAPRGEQAGGQPAAGGTGAPAIGSLPYWGKYVLHDNNRDINLALMQVRALTDWYYTAHPPIMHDLHESMALMYTFSGGPPQNPNLDPLLFAELPWFSNWELAQMTKWGMAGVYTHAFMDAWSPGYYASVAYNHNGLMKMYETQSGRDPGDGRGSPSAPPPPPPALAGTPSQSAGSPPTRGVETAPEGRQAGRGEQPAGRDAADRSDERAATQGVTPGTAAAAGPAQAAPARASLPATPAGRGDGGGRGNALPTGRGGSQDREWYRGLPVPPNAATTFTRRDNTNYMETGILSSLQLAAMFPSVIVENFYVKSRNAIEDGRTKAPYGFVIPVQRDMTRVAEMLRILRIQGIEIGQATAELKLGDATFPAGSFVVKRDQPYGRLAKNLLERQVYPDTRLTTYDDSGWTMGLEMLVDVKAISDPAILKVPTTPVREVLVKGRIVGTGTAAVAIAHYGSNNMIALRYRMRSRPMAIADKTFTAEGMEFPAGSFVVSGPATAELRSAIESLGLSAAALAAVPAVPTHDAPAPRIAIYSQWTGTQDLGWYRLTFDNFGIPYDLIYKEQVKGDLREKYDVIIMAAQNINRQTVLQRPAARPQPYQKSEKYKFLGMYGETPDMSGGFGQQGVDAVARFLEGGGTLIAAAGAVRFPIEFGWAHTVDAETIAGVTAQRPIVQAEIRRLDHPIFYGYTDKTLPIKYVGGYSFRVGVADQANILAKYVGGDQSVLSGAMTGADELRDRALAIDVPRACNGKGRVVLFANNPIYRWQNHGEFNMIFNAVLNWNYVPPSVPAAAATSMGSSE